MHAAYTWLIAWRWPRAPAQLIGLAFGLALYAGLHLSSPALMLGGGLIVCAAVLAAWRP